MSPALAGGFLTAVPPGKPPFLSSTEACMPRARAPRQEKPLQQEAHAPQRSVAPAHRN